MKPLHLALLLSLAPSLPAETAAAAQELPDLKEEIDLSIRWLRSKQDPKTGSYGHGVESTALVLRALSRSPRKYVRSDGPLVARALDFVLEHQDGDGWIADEGVDAEERLTQTLSAARALYLYVDPETTPAVARAVSWLANNGVTEPTSTELGFSDEPAEARRNALSVLSTRRADGAWDGEKGAVMTTAMAVLELSHYYPILKPKKAKPDSAQALPEFKFSRGPAVDDSILRGARFLIGASEEGKWGAPGQPDAGMTAMVIAALQAVAQPRPKDIQATIDSGLAWLVSLQREDGSIHQGRLGNYVTSASILALAASGNPEYRETILRGRDYLVALQADEGEGYSEDHPFYGGIGYGGDERPDLSNLQMALEALVASGLEEDDEAFARAVRFLERCQNRSESNDFTGEVEGVQVRPGNDGGAGYYPGESKAGFATLADGTKVPRSYGSMTYALLKGYVFAGLERDDPRVQAAWKWLCENYTLDVNPGFQDSSDPTAPYQGLFYYFHSMARALAVFETEVIVDGEGVEHRWQGELAGRLLAMQSRLDGSWINVNAPRWWEGNPVLATSYALLTLQETR